MQAIISASGGMDSTALILNVLVKDKNTHINLVSVNYGQRHDLERRRLIENVVYLKAKKFRVNRNPVDLSSIMSLFESALTSQDGMVPKDQHYEESNQRATVVPNRNAIFASLVYGLALSEAVKNKDKAIAALGIHAGDYSVYPDCRPEFLEALEIAFRMGNWNSDKVNFYAPYLRFKKREILKDAYVNCEKLGLNFDEIFRNTSTCYDPQKDLACGHCASCIERLEAFHSIGRIDPVGYAEDYELLIANMKKINGGK